MTPRSGRPSTSRSDANVKRVRYVVLCDCQLTVPQIARGLGMNRNSVQKIITKFLGMRKICGKMGPKLLNDGQTVHVRCVRTSLSILKPNQDCQGVSSPVRSHESLSTIRRSSAKTFTGKSPGSPKPEKARSLKSKPKVKLMLIASFSVSGIVHRVLATRSNDQPACLTKRSCGVCFVQC